MTTVRPYFTTVAYISLRQTHSVVSHSELEPSVPAYIASLILHSDQPCILYLT